MTTNIIGRVEKGSRLNDIDFTEEFITATFSTLLANGMSKKANELLQSVKDSNKRLYNALAKLERNSKAGKNEVRIQRDSNKVIARNRANSNAVAYGTEKTKQKAISNGVTETIREANKRQKRNDR